MAHGGYGKRRVAERKPAVGRRSKGIGVEKKPKPKSVSLKNQIRSIERMLRKVPKKKKPLQSPFLWFSFIFTGFAFCLQQFTKGVLARVCVFNRVIIGFHGTLLICRRNFHLKLEMLRKRN